jgi:hypothetical protein
MMIASIWLALSTRISDICYKFLGRQVFHMCLLRFKKPVRYGNFDPQLRIRF